MQALIISDIDDTNWQGGTGTADILLACGDLYDQVIFEAAAAYSCTQIFAVKGNHDMPPPFPPGIFDLHLDLKTYSGIKFGGLNGAWQYKPRGGFLHTQDAVQQAMASFPPVDILISQNSPFGIHDKKDEIHTGFKALNQYIQLAKPKLLIHGHQHRNVETKVLDTTVMGVYGHRLIEL